MSETYNLENKKHEGSIKKELLNFRKYNFLTDCRIICRDGSVVSIHKLLLLQKMPNFFRYLCDSCDHQSETALILPDVTKSDLEKEVENLYSFGTVSGLEEIFGLRKRTCVNEMKNFKEEEKVSAYHDIIDDSLNYLDEKINSLEKNQLGNSESDLVDDDFIFKDDDVSDIKVEEELQIHSFEFLQSKRESTSSSPGPLFVNNRFRYFCKAEWRGKFTYQCVLRRTKNCRAKALVQRDDTTGQLVILRCDNEDAHNHDTPNAKADEIVRKMQFLMIEMVKEDDLLTIEDCLTAAKSKFSQEAESQIWTDVLTHWDNPRKIRNLRKTLSRARKSSLGFTDTLLRHMKE